jgi:peptidoglycan/xylan/chitin deacetylase (PgdA/CDA1 family)
MYQPGASNARLFSSGLATVIFSALRMSHLAGILETTVSAAAVASAGALAYAVRVPSCSWLAPSIWRGTGTRPAIALTFDDGPSESTSQLLEILARYHAPASFFQCGANVRRLPSAAREVAAAGHEIGNHSHRHPLLALKSPGFIHRELRAAQEAIEHATSTRPRYFRPPYGARWFGLRAAQQSLGLQGVMWSVLALDWKMQTAAVVSRLLQGAAPGAILCLHDGRALNHRPDISVTLQAVRQLVPKLIEQGFHFEKVSDILCPTKN